ncbi:MAG: rod shape-determining protein [Acidimicrobiales bacterium]
MSGELAIDLGSSRARVVDSSGRVLVDEPCVAAVDLTTGELVAFGEAALPMPARSSGQLTVMRPVAHGQMQDLPLTDAVTRWLLKRAESVAGHHYRRPAVLCCVPGLASGVQRRAMERAFRSGGAGHVEFIEHAVAVGVGFHLRIDEPVATMVVDIGGGTTDVAVMALGGVVTEASVPLGGEDMDHAIRELCLRSFDLVIAKSVAEQVKFAIGTAWPEEEEKVEVSGRDVSNGTVRTVVLSSSEVSGATGEQVRRIVATVVECIVTSPPDLANDLLARGLHLAGNGSRLRGLARRLATTTGIPVHLGERPDHAAVLGAARCLRARTERPESRPAVTAMPLSPVDPAAGRDDRVSEPRPAVS